MMNTPLISVIIPVYNGEKYVKSCIETIRNQTFKDLEIIVVDDGSTDKSAEIASQFPVKLIRLPKNRGLSVARNTGIDNASGKYVHFMDVDDAVNSEFYEYLADAVIRTDADMACSGMVNEIKPHRTVLFEKEEVLTDIEEKLQKTRGGKWSYAVRYLFKKEFLDAQNIRFEEGRFIEDVPFTLSALYFSKELVLVPKSVYTYIYREGSIMNKKDRAHRRKKHQDMRHAKEFRHHFARKHNFKIPGVPTCGPLALFYVKWFT